MQSIVLLVQLFQKQQTRSLSHEGAELIVSYADDVVRARDLRDVARIIQADITRQEERERLLDTATNLYGLAVFAGDPARVTKPEELERTVERSMAINYEGPILLAREAAQRMKAAEVSGAIVLFATMQALSLFPGSTAYAGAKAALVHAARILAKECRGRTGIRVNVVAPGVMQAGMAEASIDSGKYDRYLAEDIIPRFGRASDVTRAVRFLLEPDNYITGQVITIDGGLTL
jgi:NAD(P)-dependent dehydrogenase (short-subunit alcohol dehydrogenase family)